MYHLGLAYIIAGAAICLSLILASDWRSANGAVFIYDNCEFGSRKNFGLSDVSSMLEATEENNCETFITKNVAVVKAELLGSMCKYLGIPANKASMAEDELTYSLESMGRLGHIILNGDFIMATHSDVGALHARKAYDLWVESGGVLPVKDKKSFLKANGIVGFENLRRLAPTGKVGVLSDGDASLLLSLLGVFSIENASMLLSVSNGLLSVMKC